MKINSNWMLVVILLSMVVLASCIDPINIQSNQENSYIVIGGQITNEQRSYIVTVEKSGTNALEPKSHIPNAIVSLISSDGEEAMLTETDPGIYQSNVEDLIGRIGASYMLQVVLEDGSIYQSTMEKLLPVPPITRMSYDLVEEPELNEVSNIVFEKRVKIKVNTFIPQDPENVFLKWNTVGEYEFIENEALTDDFASTGVGTFLFTCYVNDPIRLGDVNIFNGLETRGSQLQQQEVKSIDVDYKFAFNYCIHTKQQSLTENAYNFWNAVQQSKDRKGGLFESPPGQIIGNIQNINDPLEEVLGYFYASAVVSDRLFIPPDSVDKPVSPCLVIDPEFDSECMDCLELAGSTRDIPSYWPR